jgi:hypothetical protein
MMMPIKYYAGDKLVGLSTDTKPTNIPDGATFYESDTLSIFIKVDGVWNLSASDANSTQALNLTNLSVTANLTVNTVIANGATGSNGQVLTSNGTGVYWSTVSGGGVTGVNTGIGLTGGPITNTGTISVLANNGLSANATGVYVVPGNGLVTSNSTGVHVGAGNGITVNTTAVSVLANSGIVANSTGTFVNTAFIGTLSANNSTNLNGQPASFYTNATNLTTGTLATARLSGTYAITANNATNLNGQAAS